MGNQPDKEVYDVRKTKTRTLLTNKKEMRPSSRAGVKLDKLPEGTTKKESETTLVP